MPLVSIPVQRDLFDTRPWKPIKPSKPDPEHLYCLIRSMSQPGKKCFASARWFAKKFDVSARTIGRWLLQLSARIAVTLRPGSTSLFSTVSTGAVEKVSRVSVVSPPVGPCINPTGKGLRADPVALPAKVSAVLSRAAARIARAKNPAAYRQSIVSTELRLLERAADAAETALSAPAEVPARQPAAFEPWSAQGAPEGEFVDALRALGVSRKLA